MGCGNRFCIVYFEIFKLLDYCLLVWYVDYNMLFGDFFFILKKIKIYLLVGYILLKIYLFVFGWRLIYDGDLLIF